MGNPVKKISTRRSAAKKAAKSQSRKEVKIKWNKAKGNPGVQSALSYTLAGCRYDVHPTNDDWFRVHVTQQNGQELIAYTVKNISTAELIVSLIEDGRLLP